MPLSFDCRFDCCASDEFAGFGDADAWGVQRLDFQAEIPAVPAKPLVSLSDTHVTNYQRCSTSAVISSVLALDMFILLHHLLCSPELFCRSPLYLYRVG